MNIHSKDIDEVPSRLNAEQALKVLQSWSNRPGRDKIDDLDISIQNFFR